VFVVTDQGLVNVVLGEKLLRVAGVFAGDLIDFLEDADGAKGDVFEVADGGADEIEAAAGRLVSDVCGVAGKSLRVHAHESSTRPRLPFSSESVSG